MSDQPTKPGSRESMREILSSIRSLIDEGGEAVPAGPRPVSELLGSDTSDAALTAVDGASLAEPTIPQAARDLGGKTVEELAMEALRPLLKQWLDQHLPGIVERMVAAEVKRVTRGR
ncbi:MAG: DUF2497 domain-containing protein [Pacificimonas sp.]|jgi:cell pole-organizing protein PopZ|nr:DUF2497 domain-containing protein [Pacificimonas sp.]